MVEKFVLLDRDGVINQRIVDGYVTSWAQFVFLPGALDALRLLEQNKYTVLVLSNQAGVGKGLMTVLDLDEITRRFRERVEEHGGRIRAVYYCPHRKADNCECRKPKSGLLIKAQREHQFSFSETVLIGDSRADLLAAREVGCPAILIWNDDPADLDKLGCRPRAVVSGLYEAVQLILSWAVPSRR